MKKVILFGAGQMGTAAARLLGGKYQPLCFVDNYAPKWGSVQCGLKVLSPADGLSLKPDMAVLCVSDEKRAAEMGRQLTALGFCGELTRLEVLKLFDTRLASMRLLCEQIEALNIPGDCAELGVYKGEFAAEINRALPERSIHLFDTFEGFAQADVNTEQAERLSKAKTGDFSDTSVETVKAALPYPERAVFHRGFFPDTFWGCAAESFAFVSVDADLYAPTAAALPLFFQRLSRGGVIMVHDALGTQFTGVRKAVDEFCAENGIFYTPVCDLHGSVIIRKL